jgi:hypothetical protein
VQRKFKYPRHSTVVAYLALFIALGGSAYAVSGGSPGMIRACVSRNGVFHAPRGGQCARGQQMLVWNQQGLKGPKGDPGTAGAQGQPGSQGAQGITGPTGTVDTSQFYTKTQSDGRFAQAALFGSPVGTGAGSSADASCVIGEVKLMAGDLLATNWTLAHGQLLPINQNQALFSLLGTSFGGNGQTTFALPNLQGAEPKGAGPAGVNYAICTSGIFP